MHARRPTRNVATWVAAAFALASLAVAAPALGQVDPSDPSTSTVVDETTTTPAAPDETTGDSTAVPDATEPTDATEPAAPPAPTATDLPFPAALVAPVPPVEGNPDTAITDLYVTDGATPDEPDVVVQFREPFTFAGTPYRVGVVIGDPNGTRLRTWLISNGPENLPYGRIERFDGSAWTELGATPVRFENGLMVIPVPIDQAPAGGAVWAEIVENDADSPSHTTPYFSRDALFGTASPGTVPSAIFGRIYDLDGVGDVPLELPTGGTLVSVGGQIAVTYPDPPPTEVAGQPVTSAVDIVRIAPDYDGGSVIANFVRLDRTTGEVGLFDGFSPVPIDRSGDRSWLVAAPGPGEAGALVLDRGAIAAALGLPEDGAGAALGVSREIALEDRRLVTAEGVLATSDWLDLAPASALAEVTTTIAPVAADAGADGGEGSRLPLLIGAAAGLVVLLSAVVLLRRRGARGRVVDEVVAGPTTAPKTDRMPWGSTDGDLIITTTHEFDALIPVDATPLPGPRPPDPAVVPTAPVGDGVRILADPVAGEPHPVGEVIEEPGPPASPTASPATTSAAPPAPARVAPTAGAGSGVRILAEPVVRDVTPAPPSGPPPEPDGPPAADGDDVGPAPGTDHGPSALDAEPAWATAGARPWGVEGTESRPDDPAVEAGGDVPDGQVGDDGDEQVGDDLDADVGAVGLEPGRVDPFAALSALEDDMAELRRRVAGLGEP